MPRYACLLNAGIFLIHFFTALYYLYKKKINYPKKLSAPTLLMIIFDGIDGYTCKITNIFSYFIALIHK